MSAVEDLYRVFGAYPRPARTHGSPITTTPEDLSDLAAQPVGRVPSTTLERFFFKAMTTWGDEDDFRYYLPQILEQARSSELWLVVNKLGYGGWKDWPPAERSAIAGWIVERWQHALAAGSDDMWPVFDAMALLLDDAYAHLDELERTTDPRALEAIARRLAAAWSPAVRSRKLDAAVRGVATSRIRRQLELAFHAAKDPSLARMYSDAVQLLESLGATREPDDG